MSFSTDPAAGVASARLNPTRPADPRRAASARPERRQERRPRATGHRPHPPTHVREPACSYIGAACRHTTPSRITPACSYFARHDAGFHPGGSAYGARPVFQAASEHVPDQSTRWRWCVDCKTFQTAAGAAETSRNHQQ